MIELVILFEQNLYSVDMIQMFYFDNVLRIMIETWTHDFKLTHPLTNWMRLKSARTKCEPYFDQNVNNGNKHFLELGIFRLYVGIVNSCAMAQTNQCMLYTHAYSSHYTFNETPCMVSLHMLNYDISMVSVMF